MSEFRSQYGEEGTPPASSQVGVPPQAPSTPHPAANQARLAADLLGPTLEELRKDIREVRAHHRTEFIILLTAFAAAFLVLAGMSIGAYRWARDDALADATRISGLIDKVESRQGATNDTMIRVETKLEDLLARIPPVPTPPPHR